MFQLSQQLSQQFSASAKSHLEAHLRLVDDLAGKAFDSAGRVIALQFGASRALLDSGAVLAQQLFLLKGAQGLADAPPPQSEPAATPAAPFAASVTPAAPEPQADLPSEPVAPLVEAFPPDAPAQAVEAVAVSVVTPVASAVADLIEPLPQTPVAAPVGSPKPIEVTTLKGIQEAPPAKAARPKTDVPPKTKPAGGAPKPGGSQARK